MWHSLAVNDYKKNIKSNAEKKKDINVWQKSPSGSIGLNSQSLCCKLQIILLHSDAAVGSPAADQRGTKDFQLKPALAPSKSFPKQNLLGKKRCLKASNKEAHRRSEREASPRFTIDRLQPARG